MKKDRLTGEFIAEVFGTFILILLGDGVVANVALAPRLASEAYNWNTIAWGWGFAVVFAVYAVGGISGAHINPAVTFGLAVKGTFPWRKVIPYMVAQFIGAFLGALGVFLVYMEGLQAAGMPNVWCTGPGGFPDAAAWGATGVAAVGNYSIFNASIAEFLATAMLLWIVVSTTDMANVGVTNWNLQPFMIGMGVTAIGYTLGGPSGYSINPARDLSPRILGTLVGTQGLWDTIYWLIPPVLVPLLGGAFGCLSYGWLVEPFLPAPPEPVAVE
ncbi:MAG: MIP/aquaporin family protein [Chloroflexota bacterium]|nr:MIP/aquaporin family protein [Chloroflexota bacterium]